MRRPPPRDHARGAHPLTKRRQRGVRPAAKKVALVARGEGAADVPLVTLQGGPVEEGGDRLGAVPGEDEVAVVVLGEFVWGQGVRA